MTIFEVNISTSLSDFFKANLKRINALEQANSFLKEICGIKSFFINSAEFSKFRNSIEESLPVFEEPNRRAYGDFQTNEGLADDIVKYLFEEATSPEFLIEPTCGKGRFIVSALKRFQTLKKV